MNALAVPWTHHEVPEAPPHRAARTTIGVVCVHAVQHIAVLHARKHAALHLLDGVADGDAPPGWRPARGSAKMCRGHTQTALGLLKLLTWCQKLTCVMVQKTPSFADLRLLARSARATTGGVKAVALWLLPLLLGAGGLCSC